MNQKKLELIKYRLEQAESSLKDAEFLLENKRGSFSIINRCYYAIFYSVLALLVDKQFVGSKHSGVISFFDKEFVNKGIFHKKFSKIFHKAFDMRGKSDYKEFVEYSYEKIEPLLSQAKEFVSEVKKFLMKGYQ
ncbi:MAG: HEPN domain-containing protein [Candidatus Cloacimonadota bacterium]|nr:HEPN domain-containing protein [Candidatus Cloacimonadota bacterium]